MGNTVKHYIPYPEPADAPNIPGDLRGLAEKVDSDLDTIDTRIDTLTANWTPYTPALLAPGGGQPIIVGNGSMFADYFKLGRTCFLHIWLTFGNTTSGGTGFWGFGYPPGILPVATRGEMFGQCKAWVPNAGGNFQGQLWLRTDAMMPMLPMSSSTSVSSSVRNAPEGGGSGQSIPLAAGTYAFQSGANMTMWATFNCQ